MTITIQDEGQKRTVALDGRLDTSTAPELEKKLDGGLEDVKELVFDFEKLEYISSAGIRVLLKALKLMQSHGTMKIIHANDMVMEVFDITGFSDILEIE